MEYFRAGCVFILLGGPPGTHLWFILSDPHPETGKMLAIMAVTLQDYHDPRLILQVGDHPFIKHDTALDYGAVELFALSKLNAALGVGRCIPQEHASNGLLRKIREAVLASARTPHALKALCQELFG